MTERSETVGERVYRLRTQRGMTQRQVAAPAYTAAYVSTVEAGKVRPSEKALHHLAARLGVDSRELLTGQPAHLATGLRLGLTGAQHTLATGDTAEAAREFAGLLAEAEEYELTEESAAAQLGLGECALESGDLAQAHARFEAAERLLADAAPARRAPAVRGRAVAHLLAGELRYSCYLLENALDELNNSGHHDPDALLLLYTAAIAPYLDMGAHARAAHAAEQALSLAPSATDSARVAAMHRSVARTLLAENRIAEADASLAKAAELYRRLRLRTELAHCHWMRGYVHAQSGGLEQAEREMRIAREMLAAKRATLYAEQVEVELADVVRRRGRTDEARELLRGVLATAGQERAAVHAGAAHRLLGLIAQEAGELECAEEHYASALSLLERAGAAGDLADVCRLLGDLLRRAGRTQAAMDAYRTGLGPRVTRGVTTLGPAPAEPPA
ncbi:helix-turn-helix domain-containing protein [Streptomyces sp. PU-14G]|uniref:helix-turn-helix domain-containing protein n=1 Tax=Streptomyces sp. PU-14G TaxID=2800808 RepID=UPI0034DF1267